MSERWDPLPYFQVAHPVRDEREGQNIMAAFEAGKAEAGEDAEKLREAIRAYLTDAPLDEHGRFPHPKREALYRALGTLPGS